MSVARAIERVPPQNVEAEQSVLGSMLLDRDAIARVVEALRPEDFYRDAHRMVFIAMLELFERGEPVDLITLTDKLATLGKLEDIGGASYLAALPNTVPTAANAEYYAGIVLEKAMLRALITAGTQIAALGYEGMDEVAALVDQAEKLVYGIAARRNMQDFQTIKEILKLSFEKIDKRYRDKGTVTGIPTGFSDLDMMTSGLQPTDMIVVAARPSVGKCLSAGSEILLDNGSVCTIEELCRDRQGRILTLGAGWRFSFTAPAAFVDDGKKPAFRLTTTLGRSVECTAVHPFLTPRGWVPLAALRPGDRVAAPATLPVFGNQALPECEVKRLAYAAGTSLPRSVFTLPRAQLALFLNRFFAARGRAGLGGATRIPRLGCSAASRDVARQVQHLLLRFGVITAVHPAPATSGYSEAAPWAVEMTDPHSIKRFVGEIGIVGKDARLRRLVALLDVPGSARAPQVPAGAAGGGRSAGSPMSSPQAPTAVGLALKAEPGKTGDVCWEEIAAIEPVGLKQVYDLTVAGTHNFVANDICVHNTTFALNLAQHAAITNKIPVAIFSLETSKEQLVQRILCSEARVDNSKLRTGYLADDDWRKLARAMGSLSEAPIFIDDSATLSVMEMRAKARKLKAEHGLGLIVIDYIQLIQSFKRPENRTQELSEIARGIKSLAKELDLPIVAISQLSRAVEMMGSKRPMLSHLRECVTAGTVVWDADTGERYTIGQLSRLTSSPRLLSLDATGKLVPIRPTAVIDKGENEVVQIRTSTGRRLTATAEHPVLTPEGWKAIGELKPRDRIAAVRRLPVFHAGPATLSPDRMRLLGYLIGDGSYQRHRGVSFISSDPTTLEDCTRIAEREFNVLTRSGSSHGVPEVDFVPVLPRSNSTQRAYGRPHGNLLREWLVSLGIEGQSTYEERIPELVFQHADRKGVRALLRALYSTDGCLTRRTYTKNSSINWSLHYDTVSWGLAEDVRDLLLRFGIVAQVSSGYTSKKATTPVYRVCVEDVNHLRTFCDEIGIEGRKGELVAACAQELAGKRAKPWTDRLPYSVTGELWTLKEAAGGSWQELGFRLQTGKTLDRATALSMGNRLGATSLMQQASSDVLWDPVVSVAPAGREHVYDLVMPRTHNFVADGLVAHNSGEIEQVSDLVVFLYREDYYDPERAQKDNKENVCELIIAKHRNGPIGNVELYFHKEHSRFANLDRRR